jgi:hypothetical protein
MGPPRDPDQRDLPVLKRGVALCPPPGHFFRPVPDGWNVETRDSLARIPLLYGENGKPLYGLSPDAIYVDDDGYRALLKIEGGGAVQNNRLMKDVVETLLIPGAHHLALAVPHSIHGRSPYDFAINLISALYAREVAQRHVRGILVVGY